MVFWKENIMKSKIALVVFALLIIFLFSGCFEQKVQAPKVHCPNIPKFPIQEYVVPGPFKLSKTPYFAPKISICVETSDNTCTKYQEFTNVLILDIDSAAELKVYVRELYLRYELLHLDVAQYNSSLDVLTQEVTDGRTE
jgi:hypothetical protein